VWIKNLDSHMENRSNFFVDGCGPFAEIDDFADIITDESDGCDDDGYLPQASDKRSEVRVFLASPTKNFPKTIVIFSLECRCRCCLSLISSRILQFQKKRTSL